VSNSASTSGVRCMIMRGGTSKGLYFVADDLPSDPIERDSLLLSIMGSPDDRQIDGLGGAHPLTSKVAVVSRSADDDADVDYLFLQVVVDRAIVTDQQNCGNILAGVGPFAVERGLVPAPADGITEVRIRLLNGGGVATSAFPVTDGRPRYDGDCAIAGVPGTAAPIQLDFHNTAGSATGALLPTGNTTDVIDGVTVTCIDNGMPVVVLAAIDLGITGYETCEELETNAPLRARLEQLRSLAGHAMGLGDVTNLTIPKMTLVAPPVDGGTLCTRTFIPHRCHDAIGVLGAVSVATATLMDGTPAAAVATLDQPGRITVEHPTGSLDATVEFADDGITVRRSGILRTSRALMDGIAYPRL
jgi:4-oxalomesaconate tautomerase